MRDQRPSVPDSRRRLASVLRNSGDVIHIADAARILGFTRTQAAKLLSRWTGQGWLRRVGHGIYVPVPLDSLESVHVLDDPWILVPALYSPAYIGGRTAAQHWDLTEQIFRDIVVLTAQPVRTKSQIRHGAPFSLKHINARKIFGIRTLWRGRSRITISDLHRTIVDILDDPKLGGGIQHVADCLTIYLFHAERDDGKILAYGDRLGNGAVFKRLGFLAERTVKEDSLIKLCRERITKGNVALDPTLPCPRLVTRWKLRIPQNWITKVARA